MITPLTKLNQATIFVFVQRNSNRIKFYLKSFTASLVLSTSGLVFTHVLGQNLLAHLKKNCTLFFVRVLVCT